MDFSTLRLEIGAAVLGIFLLALGIALPEKRRSLVAWAAAMGFALLIVLGIIAPGGPGAFLGGLYLSDSFALFFKLLFSAGALLAALMSLHTADAPGGSGPEYFALLAFALVGAMMLASANDFLTLYIGLELMSLPLVALTAWEKRSGKAAEAGVKYVLLGAMSSAILLFGLSLVYGSCGSLSYAEVLSASKAALAGGAANPGALALLGGVMAFSGFAFKVAAVPFHMWSPDIYEGAPTPVAAFLAVVSKAAGFAALVRIAGSVLAPLGSAFTLLAITLAALSMVVGNLSAIPQTGMKRLLAWSSIAHAGYIMLGIVAWNAAGVGALLYYVAVYLFATIGAFACATVLAGASGSDTIASFRGMWKRSPFVAAAFTVCLLSLAGIPPAAGFLGKFYLFAEIAKQGMLWLVGLALAMSVVSLYYYVMVIRTLVMEEPAEAEGTVLKVPLALCAVIAVAVLGTILLGIFPGPLTEWTAAVARSMFG